VRLIIVSGLSGSGKSVALSTLEDEGFYCVDNLPTTLLMPLVEQFLSSSLPLYQRVAVGIDARNDAGLLDRFTEAVSRLRHSDDVTLEILFLQTERDTLLKRFSETRRRHPLSQQGIPLSEAIEVERNLLSTISEQADITIETTNLNLHQLRAQLRERLLPDTRNHLSLLLQSFGFRHGVPADTDFMFDARCLPNPHWQQQLRSLTGEDPGVIEFLEFHPEVTALFESIRAFLERWIPAFEREARSYLTISIGCTGGQHRSVYLANRLAHALETDERRVTVRHRDL